MLLHIFYFVLDALSTEIEDIIVPEYDTAATKQHYTELQIIAKENKAKIQQNIRYAEKYEHMVHCFLQKCIVKPENADKKNDAIDVAIAFDKSMTREKLGNEYKNAQTNPKSIDKERHADLATQNDIVYDFIESVFFDTAMHTIETLSTLESGQTIVRNLYTIEYTRKDRDYDLKIIDAVNWLLRAAKICKNTKFAYGFIQKTTKDKTIISVSDTTNVYKNTDTKETLTHLLQELSKYYTQNVNTKQTKDIDILCAFFYMHKMLDKDNALVFDKDSMYAAINMGQLEEHKTHKKEKYAAENIYTKHKYETNKDDETKLVDRDFVRMNDTYKLSCMLVSNP